MHDFRELDITDFLFDFAWIFKIHLYGTLGAYINENEVLISKFVWRSYYPDGCCEILEYRFKMETDIENCKDCSFSEQSLFFDNLKERIKNRIHTINTFG